jgi:hypothetical protein
MAWTDNDRIAVHVGATYEDDPIVVVGDDIVEQPQVLGFGTSPDGRLFALAFDDVIQVRAAWDARRLPSCNGPLARRDFRLAIA